MAKLANSDLNEVKKPPRKAKQEESIEKQLWKAADKLRKNIDAAEYKHVVMGLVFLKYISDSFEELYNSLKSEDRDEYKMEEEQVLNQRINDNLAKVVYE